MVAFLNQCHVDRDGHRRMKCDQPCMRVQCPRNHPCPKTCSENCGNCLFPVYNVALPCGHVMERVPWCVFLRQLQHDASLSETHVIQSFAIERLSDVFCTSQVTKQLPNCEHIALVACSEDLRQVQCNALCGGSMQCCSRTCRSQCWKCQMATQKASGRQPGSTIIRFDRTQHEPHSCERVLVCQHTCGVSCNQEHRCNTQCQKPCRQQCVHHKCPKPCSVPCPPCMEPCPWACPHAICPVVCGSVRFYFPFRSMTIVNALFRFALGCHVINLAVTRCRADIGARPVCRYPFDRNVAKKHPP
jgi:hypothetical protein